MRLCQERWQLPLAVGDGAWPLRCELLWQAIRSMYGCILAPTCSTPCQHLLAPGARTKPTGTTFLSATASLLYLPSANCKMILDLGGGCRNERGERKGVGCGMWEDNCGGCTLRFWGLASLCLSEHGVKVECGMWKVRPTGGTSRTQT